MHILVSYNQFGKNSFAKKCNFVLWDAFLIMSLITQFQTCEILLEDLWLAQKGRSFAFIIVATAFAECKDGQQLHIL